MRRTAADQGTAGPRPLWSIQYLRAVAALMVVVHHARNPKPWLFNPLTGFDLGSAGVAIFFVISGFIMFGTIGREAPANFLGRRIGRIVPMYWFATLLLLAAKQALGGQVLDARLVADVVQSMLFVPHVSAQKPWMVWPYLVPGWTLNLEMFFYVVLAAGAVLRRPVTIATGLLGVLVLAGAAIQRPGDPFWFTYTNQIMLDFLCGLGVGWLFRQFDLRRWRWLLPVGAVLLLPTFHLPAARLFLCGVPASLIVIGALGWEDAGRVPRLALMKLLGDASYSIYLLQVFAIGLSGVLVQALPAGPFQLASMILLSLVVATALGVAGYRWVEKPLLRALSPRRRPPPPAVLVPSAAD